MRAQGQKELVGIDHFGELKKPMASGRCWQLKKK
jgi:hypothetical protein